MSSTCSPSKSYEFLIQNGMLQEWRGYICDWPSFQRFAAESDSWRGWLFRGQSNWQWELESSLRREANRQSIPDIVERELGIIRRFKREYSQYRGDSPTEDDYVQWMSIMRHFGGPTRLLDITYSPFVGLYFAAIDAVPDTESAIWCFNTEWLDRAYMKRAPRWYRRELSRDKHGVFINLYKTVLNDRSKKVYTLNPFKMLTRLVRQQGGFLLPTDVEVSFMENLAAMDNGPWTKPCIIKVGLNLESSDLKDMFLGLYRMNISAATLFPGLSGFADSLRMIMSYDYLTYCYSRRFD